MSFRTSGEHIEGLGEGFFVEPLSRWKDTSLYGTAVTEATHAFVAAGALLPVRIDDVDVLVQAYPGLGKLAFVFRRKIAGEMMYYPYVFDLPPGLVQELRVAGKWMYEQ